MKHLNTKIRYKVEDETAILFAKRHGNDKWEKVGHCHLASISLLKINFWAYSHLIRFGQ